MTTAQRRAVEGGRRTNCSASVVGTVDATGVERHDPVTFDYETAPL
jgi:hypothetical protein